MGSEDYLVIFLARFVAFVFGDKYFWIDKWRAPAVQRTGVGSSAIAFMSPSREVILVLFELLNRGV